MPVIKITKAGYIYIALTIFLGVSAVNTANNLIYLIVSALLSFMGISGFFGKRNLSKIDVAAELPEEIYANKGFPLRIRLQNNKGFLPVFLMRVNICGSEVLIPFADKKGDSIRHANISFEQRGRHEIKDVHICSVFPFNFFIRCRRLDNPVSFVVFPEPRKSELPGFFERERMIKGERLVDKAGYEADILSIREYMHGDPFKYINWKATAKTGELKTKELSSSAHRPVMIDFDAIEIKNREEKISSVTYIILQFLKKNIPVGLKIGERIFNPEVSNSHKISMLTELALLDK
jgi:uncharacterized protein (DUF58 family)